ncbi:MAG: hypothetical protein ABIX28_03360 [Vicinamibacterales bacterium]
MRDDVNAQYRRWLDADEQGNDDEADASFERLFDACVPTPLPSVRFTETTMAAVASASLADAKRARRLRQVLLWSGGPLAAVSLYFGAGAAVWALSTGLVAGLNFLVAAVVWFANGHDVRSSLWTMLTGLGRAALAFAADPRVTIAILVFQAVAVAALAALHRLLGPEREWLK